MNRVRVPELGEFVLMFGLHLLVHWAVESLVALLLPGVLLAYEIVPVAAATAAAMVLDRRICHS